MFLLHPVSWYPVLCKWNKRKLLCHLIAIRTKRNTKKNTQNDWSTNAMIHCYVQIFRMFFSLSFVGIFIHTVHKRFQWASERLNQKYVCWKFCDGYNNIVNQFKQQTISFDRHDFQCISLILTVLPLSVYICWCVVRFLCLSKDTNLHKRIRQCVCVDFRWNRIMEIDISDKQHELYLEKTHREEFFFSK